MEFTTTGVINAPRCRYERGSWTRRFKWWHQ